ncbi:MAG TPA: DUF2249 domain-containing protein [Flavipsychrobacter sp.]|nr:DUF2249 domain-containing protein [Flavipsychrobacter sp.]
MNIIDANTKISALIKANPKAIDAIASINDHFKKLYNPILRKILASRVTISEAAKIGKVDISVFFERLKPLGFEIDETVKTNIISGKVEKAIRYDKLLDVREDLASGKDPFKKIMEEVNNLGKDETLLLINSFEPIPLIRILNDRGYEAVVKTLEDEIVHTYITRSATSINNENALPATDFETILTRYQGKMQEIDVRALPMPQPMMTILKAIETLDADKALFVYHKKVPLFLLPELKDRNFSFAYKQVEDGVHLIIYKEQTS